MSADRLAPVNIARLLEPLTSPRLADFVNQLDEVNAIADAAPSRPRTPSGSAPSSPGQDASRSEDDWFCPIG